MYFQEKENNYKYKTGLPRGYVWDRLIQYCFYFIGPRVFIFLFEKVGRLHISHFVGISFQTFVPTYENLIFEISNLGLGICDRSFYKFRILIFEFCS